MVRMKEILKTEAQALCFLLLESTLGESSLSRGSGFEFEFELRYPIQAEIYPSVALSQ